MARFHPLWGFGFDVSGFAQLSGRLKGDTQSMQLGNVFEALVYGLW